MRREIPILTCRCVPSCRSTIRRGYLNEAMTVFPRYCPVVALFTAEESSSLKKRLRYLQKVPLRLE